MTKRQPAQPESTRSYRGLLRELSPRVHVKREDGGVWVTVWITVPHVKTGKPVRVRTSETALLRCPKNARRWRPRSVDDMVRSCFERALVHEVEEGLVFDGQDPEAH